MVRLPLRFWPVCIALLCKLHKFKQCAVEHCTQSAELTESANQASSASAELADPGWLTTQLSWAASPKGWLSQPEV